MARKASHMAPDSTQQNPYMNPQGSPNPQNGGHRFAIGGLIVIIILIIGALVWGFATGHLLLPGSDNNEVATTTAATTDTTTSAATTAATTDAATRAATDAATTAATDAVPLDEQTPQQQASMSTYYVSTATESSNDTVKTYINSASLTDSKVTFAGNFIQTTDPDNAYSGSDQTYTDTTLEFTYDANTAWSSAGGTGVPTAIMPDDAIQAINDHIGVGVVLQVQNGYLISATLMS